VENRRGADHDEIEEPDKKPCGIYFFTHAHNIMDIVSRWEIEEKNARSYYL